MDLETRHLAAFVGKVTLRVRDILSKAQVQRFEIRRGEPKIEAFAEAETSSSVGRRKSGDSERFEKLESEVVTLTMEVRKLQQQFEEFKKQFE